jgi:uncharacterized protein YbjT (DUF2867 family)
MMRVLVIGATGRIGREVLAQLPRADVRIRALVRNAETAALPPDVEAARGDLTRPETLERCLDGVDAVFLVWTAAPAAAGPALERITACARRVVFLSSPHKTPHPFFQQPNPGRVLHAEIERLIEGSAREWTFLRPGMFAANALGWWAPRIRAGAETVRWPYAAAPTAPIHERDVAAVAVRALCEEGHAGAEYVLTGPDSLSQSEQVAIIGDAVGRPLRLEELTPEAARTELAALFPPVVMTMLFDAWAAALGQPAFVTSTVAALTGTPARTFGEWAADRVAAFRP